MLVVLAFTLLFALPVNAAQSTGSAPDSPLKTRVEQTASATPKKKKKVAGKTDGDKSAKPAANATKSAKPAKPAKPKVSATTQ